MADDSGNVDRAVRLLREAADVLAQAHINVDTSSSQSTSITTPNMHSAVNQRSYEHLLLKLLEEEPLDRDELAAGL